MPKLLIARPFLRFFAACLFLFAFSRTPAVEKPAHRQLPDVDKRTKQALKGQRPAATVKQARATERLQSRVHSAKVDYHEVHGAPQWVRAASGFLTTPDGVGGQASIKRFVNDYSDLFGHNSATLSPLTLTRQYTNSHNGVRSFAWEQRLDGIPVYESIFLGHITAQGEVISVSSTFLPELDTLAADTLVGRELIETLPPLLAEDAISLAAASIEEPLDVAAITPIDLAPQGAEQHQRFAAAGVPGEIDARLTWLPMDQSDVRLCWQIEITRRVGGERHRVLVEVETGEILYRRCLTVFATEATYRVFTSDSPSPLSPGHPTPSTNQPPFVPRSLVTQVALFTNASPIGWINEGENQTRGNNVDAHLDRNADDQPDLPRPQGSPFRVFDFPQDLTQPPSTYGDAAAVQLFYWCNWMHDQLYELGFDEAAGNYQKDNFGRGGVGNDPVLADAQDGSGFNNANFTPTYDGTSPRIQMYVFNGPTPGRDGDFDADIILHEYTHGLSDRLVGGGVGISALQTGGMGEGWSDFYALTLLSEASDDIDGAYAMGGYATYQLVGLTQNYYYGIRRYPYSTDMSKNPLTFKDIDPFQAVPHTGVPISPINPFNPLFANEVHAQGEVWCVTLWDVRANLIRKHGFSVGNRLVLQLVTDGMKLGPANPTFVQARDAILLADEVNNGGANLDAIWAAFAKRGLGFSAVTISSADTAGSVEAFNLPDSLSVVPSRPFVSAGGIGGPFSPQCMTYLVTNRSSNALSWSLSAAEPWLTLSISGGTLAPQSGTNVTVCIAPGAANLSPGVFRDSLLFSNRTSHFVQPRAVELRINGIAQLPFNDGFESGRLEGHWLATGTGPFRTRVTTTDLPHAGAFHATFDSAVPGVYARNELSLAVDLGGYTNAMLRFWIKNLGDESDGPPESPFIDGADFDGVAISEDGVRWYEVQSLRNLSTLYREYTVDLDKAAAVLGLNYNSNFRIRFNRYDDNSIPFDGIALDDVSLTATPVNRFTLMAPARVAEGSGVLSNQGRVTLATPAVSNLVLRLTSSRPSRLVVPASVTIPGGSTSATFDLTVADDALLNGTEEVTLSASASGYFGLPTVVSVDDNEIAGMKLRVPAKAVEGAGMLSKSGSIKLNQRADRPLAVALSSSNPLLVSVPPVVNIAAGETTAPFDIIVNNDQGLNGTRIVRVTAHVQNWMDASADISISDDDSARLALILPERVSEGNGTLTNVATVRLSATVPSNVVVSLISSAPAQLQVAPQLIIPAGQDSAQFNLTVVDDFLVNGLRTISITASASPFRSITAQVGLVDDETPPVPYQPAPANNAVNVPVATELSWKPGFGEALVNGGFETGDFTAWRLENADYGSFFINDGKFDPEGAEGPTAPYNGKFSVVTSQIGSGQHLLYQDVLIPLDAKSARLSWADKIRNYADRFIPFAHEFRVEIRDTTNNLLATLFATNPGDRLTNDWTRRVFDMTQFRGQTIRVTFIERDFLNYFNVHIDDVSLYLEESGLTTFDVYFGTNSVFKPSDLRGTTTNAFWTLSTLALNTTYYWKIVEHRGPAVTSGPLWKFTTRGVGSLHHFEWSAIAGTQQLSEPFPVALSARDDIGNLVTGFNGSVQLSAIAGPVTASAIMITEIDTGADDRVEFQNVSGRAVDISGWKMILYDRSSWPAPRVTVTVPPKSTCPRDALFQLFRLGTAPGIFPAFYSGTNTSWNNAAIGNPMAVLLTDANDNVVDFVCAYDANPAQMKTPFTNSLPPAQWIGNAVAPSTNGLLTFQRVGGTDHNNATDWVVKATSIGKPNDGLTLPFAPARPINLSPTVANLVSGVWSGQATISQVISNMTLFASDGTDHFGLSSRFDVRSGNDLALGVSYAPDLTIPGDPIRYVLTVHNGGPEAATGVTLTSVRAPTAQFVSATATQGECVVLDGVLTCTLGTLQAGADVVVTVVEASTAPGPLASSFHVTREGVEAYLSNNTVTAVSTVNLPLLAISDVSVNEGNSGTSSATFTVRLTPPSTLPVSVNYSTSNRTAMAGSDFVGATGTIVFPPGVTNQSLVITIVGDTLSEAFETFEVDLFSPENAAVADGLGIARIFDDDPVPTIRIGDAIVTEPVPGASSNVVFAVTLSAVSALPVSASFITSNGTAVAEKDYVPQLGSLEFAPGVTNVEIVVSVLGDRAAETAESFFVHLSSAVNGSIGRAIGQGTVLDNGFSELDHFSFGTWPSVQSAGVPFAVPILARDGLNKQVTNFSGRVSIKGAIPRPDVAVGASSTVWNNPFGTLYEDARTQVIYLANELGGAGDFSGISLFVSTPPGQTMSNWTIRLKHTALTKYAQPAWESIGWHMAYQNHEIVSATGWVSFIFSAPFHYDGTNNLLVDLSFNNGSYSTDGRTRFFSTADKRTLFFRTDSAFGDPLAWSGTNSPPPSATNAVPVIRFLREDAVSVSPTTSTDFADGISSTLVTVNEAATNMLLRVSDGAGHNGASDLFSVANAQPFRPETFRIGNLRIVNGQLRLQFQSVAGKAYRLERAADPGATNWTVVNSFILGTGEALEIIDPEGATQPAQFYRLRLLP